MLSRMSSLSQSVYNTRPRIGQTCLLTHRQISVDSKSHSNTRKLHKVRASCAQLRVAAETYHYELKRLKVETTSLTQESYHALLHAAIACERTSYQEWDTLCQLAMDGHNTKYLNCASEPKAWTWDGMYELDSSSDV